MFILFLDRQLCEYLQHKVYLCILAICLFGYKNKAIFHAFPWSHVLQMVSFMMNYTHTLFHMLLSWKPSTISVRLDFLKCVQIFLSSKTPISTECLDLLYKFAWLTRKSRHTFCTDLRFEENENLDKLEKNLDGQKLLRVSNSECSKDR